MDLKTFHNNILRDVKTELADEFDRNFERKAFFEQPWPKNKLINRRGSMMARTNNLRRSMRAKINGYNIAFSSSLPYAGIQNEGGEIVVTQKMKSYFWAMYYQAGGKVVYNVKTKEMANTKANKALSIEAEQFKALALMPIGKKIKIPSRRFIGKHPKIKNIIEDCVNRNLEELNDYIKNNLKQK